MNGITLLFRLSIALLAQDQRQHMFPHPEQHPIHFQHITQREWYCADYTQALTSQQYFFVVVTREGIGFHPIPYPSHQITTHPPVDFAVLRFDEIQEITLRFFDAEKDTFLMIIIPKDPDADFPTELRFASAYSLLRSLRAAHAPLRLETELASHLLFLWWQERRILLSVALCVFLSAMVLLCPLPPWLPNRFALLPWSVVACEIVALTVIGWRAFRRRIPTRRRPKTPGKTPDRGESLQ